MTTEAADNSASDSDRGARQQGGCMSSRLRSAAGMLVVVVAFLGVLAGCGGSSAPSPSSAAKASTTSSTGGCADVAALKASLAALTQVRPLQDGVAALQAAIANVKTSLDTAVASAPATLQPEVAQVKSAFAVVQASVTGLSTDNLTQKAPSIVAALTQLGTAASGLASALTQNCPGS